MPRKSKALRLQQTRDLVASFNASPEHQTAFGWDYRFLNSILQRLDRGQKINKKQRDILDDKIEIGLPDLPSASPLGAELREALEQLPDHKSFAWTKRVGTELVVKLNRGWNLSEKQIALVNRFIQESKDYQNLEPLGDAEMAHVKFLVALSNNYDGSHWYNCAKQGSYVEKGDAGARGIIKLTPKDVQNLEYAVRGELKRWRKAQRFSSGSLCVYTRNGRERGIVIEGPFVENDSGQPLGKIAFHIMVNGELLENVDQHWIKTR